MRIREKDQRRFLHYVGPSVIGMLIGGSFSIVDAIFIGQATGKIGLAAVAITWPVEMVLAAVGQLFAAGGAVRISQARGSGDEAIVQRTFSATATLAIASALLLMLVTIPLMPQILTLLGAGPELMPQSLPYARTVIAGLILSNLMLLAMEVVRNDGHPTLSMWILVSGLVGNIILDWFFLLYLNMGVFGAAIATVISQGLSATLGLVYFFSKKTTLRFRLGEMLHPHLTILKDVTLTGIPVFGNMFSIIGMLYMHNAQSLKYGGIDALAVYTVVTALESLGSMIMTGIAAGVQPLAAEMYGAGQWRRQNRFGNYGYALAFLIGIILMIFSFIMRHAAPALMGLTGETAILAAHAIVMSAPAFIFLGVIRVAGFYYQSTGKITTASWLIYGDTFLALPFCLYTLPVFIGLNGVWLAMPISRLLLLAMLGYFWFFRPRPRK